VYLGHQWHLGRHHPYRRNCVAFDGQLQGRLAPTQVFIINFLRRAKERDEWLNRRMTKDKDDHVHIHGVKRKNIFFHLPYWQVETKICFDVI
jgi:hypothetical protein